MSYFLKYSNDMMKQFHNRGFVLERVEKCLKNFNKYCEEYYPNEKVLTKELAEKWICSSSSKSQLYNRVITMKYLGKYLNSLGLEAYIPNYSVKLSPHPPPTLFNNEQLSRFFYICDHITPDKRFPNREFIIPIIFRVIYSCGLRSSEACKLKVEDVDLEKGTITIFHSKGFKDRVVYMSDSLLALCKSFNNTYNRILPGRKYFFQLPYKEHLINEDICRNFNIILKKCNFSNEFAKKTTTHGLRHLFAVKSMKKCLDMGYNFDNWIKYLSQYMGHRSTKDTMYYLHLVPQLLPEYSKKMHNFTEGIGVIYEED